MFWLNKWGFGEHKFCQKLNLTHPKLLNDGVYTYYRYKLKWQNVSIKHNYLYTTVSYSPLICFAEQRSKSFTSTNICVCDCVNAKVCVCPHQAGLMSVL